MEREDKFVWPWWLGEGIENYNPDLNPDLIPFKPDFRNPAPPGTLRDQMGLILRIIVRNYSYLSVKHIEGNPQDGQFGVMIHKTNASDHSYEIYSQGLPIGMYNFVIELLDGDVVSKRFTFYRTSNVKKNHRGKSYYRGQWDKVRRLKNGKVIEFWSVDKNPAREQKTCTCSRCGN